jgi:hypothetical protein
MSKPFVLEEDRRIAGFHEAGHMAIFYWRRIGLHQSHIVIHRDRAGASVCSLEALDRSELDLMVLLGGPLAELLFFWKIVPKTAIRFRSEYRLVNSDTTRIRNLVKSLCDDRDDRQYQFRVQERCREIIQTPPMFRAITEIASVVVEKWEISGNECEEIFERSGAPQVDFGRFSFISDSPVCLPT